MNTLLPKYAGAGHWSFVKSDATPLRSSGRVLGPLRQRNSSRSGTRAQSSKPLGSENFAVDPGATVLVVGATGGVGQLLTAKLLERGYNVKALIRNPDKAAAVLGSNIPGLEFIEGETRDPESLTDRHFKGVQAVLVCTGTTAFPSKRWDGGNHPKNIDYVGTTNLIDAVRRYTAPGSIRRVVLVTSAGVERFDRPPYAVLNLFRPGSSSPQHAAGPTRGPVQAIFSFSFGLAAATKTAVSQAQAQAEHASQPEPLGTPEPSLIGARLLKKGREPLVFPYRMMNMFGVLRYKKAAEEYLVSSRLPYTLIRPGRLTDGPYTSYDLNTLLGATSGTRRDVTLAATDRLDGQASRIAVAEAMVQCLAVSDTAGKAFSLESTEGDGPGTDPSAWKDLFMTAI